ncbi:Mechanosensitive channel MscK precursor [compost metagenome]
MLKVGETPLLDTSNLFPLIRRLLALVYWTVVLLLTYEWLTFVLQRFPYTRPWGESLDHYLLNLLRYVLDAIVSAIPGLVIALMIFFIARGISAFSKRVLERLSRPGTITWLNHETLQPTTRLTSLAIWLFALAMAYPYLPGAGTEAFKGLSVLVGLMISLGASSVVGQAAAGLILTYTRTLRPGEFVRIGEHEGTVTELGMFTTSIRTGLGEVLTIPNSMITGTVTKNYSRVVQGAGYVVDTVVTIGYDTPWRQVEAMLLEAAQRTPGIVPSPAPQVFQTALSDFYPEYRLVAQAVPSEPRPRAELLSMLHANVQDVFNEYGVQIMSPHYLGDPEHEKRVPKERWFSAPAQEPSEKGDRQ